MKDGIAKIEEAQLTPVGELVRRFPELAVCRGDIECVVAKMVGAFAKGRKLLVCGNGGSWADAHHIAGELMKSFTVRRPVSISIDGDGDVLNRLEGGVPVVVLGSAGAFASAFANDVDASLVYAQEVQVMGNEGDIFLGISTSGNAKNVAYAAQVARAKKMTVLGLTGQSGGILKPLCDCAVCVPEQETYRLQELHLPVYHTLCRAIELALWR